ncbi:ABC transporter permease [Actinomadura kijaniata]|uniref:ABC transporter permease n=1 Tax=Actinomadura kijaniata TaxID=46161 RepID=UPI003F1B837A
MNPTAATRGPAPRLPDVRPSVLVRIARLDLTLLWRNRTALFTVAGLPLMFGALLLPARGRRVDGLDAALLQGTGHLAFFLVFAVFMNLVNVFTARREDLTLKRLRGTSLSDAEILCGSVLTSAALYLAQAAALVALLMTALGGGPPANLPLMLAGMAGGVVVFALLGFVFAGLTPNSDMAQLTVLPVMFGCLAGAGVMFPLTELPGWARQAAHWLPLSPVVEIVRTGYLGRDFHDAATHGTVGLAGAWAATAPSFAVLAAWTAFGVYAARRWFRWEPRRG